MVLGELYHRPHHFIWNHNLPKKLTFGNSDHRGPARAFRLGAKNKKIKEDIADVMPSHRWGTGKSALIIPRSRLKVQRR